MTARKHFLTKVSSAGFQDHSTAQTLNVCIDSLLRQWPPSPVSFVHRRTGKGIRLASRSVLHRQRFLRALRIRANEARRTSLLAAPPPSASPPVLSGSFRPRTMPCKGLVVRHLLWQCAVPHRTSRKRARCRLGRPPGRHKRSLLPPRRCDLLVAGTQGLNKG